MATLHGSFWEKGPKKTLQTAYFSIEQLCSKILAFGGKKRTTKIEYSITDFLSQERERGAGHVPHSMESTNKIQK